MKLSSAFIQLPLKFDTERLIAEVEQFTEEEWIEHPQEFFGNNVLALISHKGQLNHDGDGSMAVSPLLLRCPYIQQVLASINTVWGHSRLMLLKPGASVPQHQNNHYRWRKKIRVHIPIITNTAVTFSSINYHTKENTDIHIRAGEVWFFDHQKTHAIYNNSDKACIHLIADTSGSSDFWALAQAANKAEYKTIRYNPAITTSLLKMEVYNKINVRSPNDVEHMMDDLLNEFNDVGSTDEDSANQIHLLVSNFKWDWRSLWSQYGESTAGITPYNELITNLQDNAKPILEKITIGDNLSMFDLLQQWLAAIYINEDDVKQNETLINLGKSADISIARQLFNQPIFIVAAPRSGSTLLFELLQQNKELWTIGGESHSEFEGITKLNIANHNFDSNHLSSDDLDDDIAIQLIRSFLQKLQNADGQLFYDLSLEQRSNSFRFLEKTPKNALRIGFLNQLFPDAKFIYLHRHAEQNIGSIIDAWHSGRFVTYPNLPGWTGMPWSLLLPKGWRNMKNQSVADIAAWQWQQANLTIINELEKLDSQRYCSISYDNIINNRPSTLQKLCHFSDIPFGPKMQQLAQQPMAHSKYTLSVPSAEKWKRHQHDIEKTLPELQSTIKRITAFTNS